MLTLNKKSRKAALRLNASDPCQDVAFLKSFIYFNFFLLKCVQDVQDLETVR